MVGPAMGGLFAQFGLWRWAFGAMAVLTTLMAALVPAALAANSTAEDTPTASALRVPIGSLLLVGAAALAVSIAQLPRNAVAISALLAVGVMLVAAFVVVDCRSRVTVLPPSVFGTGPLKWIYLTSAVLMMAVMVDTYVPLFGQRLGHLTPVAAGFLGASLAIGWTVSEIVSASLSNPRVIDRVVLVAPLLMAAGLASGAVTQRADASLGLIAVWAVALLVAGTGIGMAWPHLSARAMDSVDDPCESGAAAAAINTVQLISAAFGAGLAGVVVNDAAGGEVMEARWLYTVFTVLAALGVLASHRATRRARGLAHPPATAR